MIKRCRRLIGGKTYSQRKGELVAWFALDHLDVLDPRAGVFDRKECQTLLKTLAGLIPRVLPCRWPWFPFSQEAGEAALSLR